MENQTEKNPSPKKKFYVESMILGMLLGVVLVMGTPLFNPFIKEPQTGRLNVGTGAIATTGLSPVVTTNTGGSSW